MANLSPGKGPDTPFEGLDLFVHSWYYSLVLDCFAPMLSKSTGLPCAFMTHERCFCSDEVRIAGAASFERRGLFSSLDG